MVRSTAIPLLILAGISQTPTGVGAASITYDVVNYPTLQNGYTVTGTITTNGAIGLTLPATDITSWAITITKGTTRIAEFDPTNTTNLTNAFGASLSAITLGIGEEFINFTQTVAPLASVRWVNEGTIISYVASTSEGQLWDSNLPSPSPVAAAVPEPPSAVLASIGAVAAFLAYGWSRHRRAKRRQAAA